MRKFMSLRRSKLAAIGVVLFCALQSYAASVKAAPSKPNGYDQLTIGVLLGNPTTRRIIARYIPNLLGSRVPQSVRRHTLKSLHEVDPRVTNSLLKHIYAALAALSDTSEAAELSPPPTVGPTNIPDSKLDPARNLKPSRLESVVHKRLPEQYIWTYSNASRPGFLRPQYFRRRFQISKLPQHATLYVAGPRQAKIYIDGRYVGQYEDSLNLEEITHVNIHVYHKDVSHALHVGTNVIAIEAVRGPTAGNEAWSSVSRHLHDGRVLAVMIEPAERGIEAPPLMMSDAKWRATDSRAPAGWYDTDFNDSTWRNADDLGGIESAIGLFQANADAGLYAWPGYQGISPFLAQYHLRPLEIRRVVAGVGAVRHSLALTEHAPTKLFSVTLPAKHVSRHDSPQIMLDFGREVTGRLEFISDSEQPAEVTVQYGESAADAILQPFLGADPVYIPPRGTAYGPKSGFRYALIRFIGGRSTRFRSIRLDGIAYPVTYRGSFESSSPLLNKIWTIGAYTAHLCMQDGIWDGAKRDRNLWAGDLDVSGRTIEDVFGTRFLMKVTLNRLIGPVPVKKQVNQIPGYSAFWINTVYNYYLHTGSLSELRHIHMRLIELLSVMGKSLDRHAEFADLTRGWPFVDWAPGMHRYDRQTRMATQFEYYQAFKDGVYLLRVLHDKKNARRVAVEAAEIKAAAQKYMSNTQGTFGNRWQPNAYAVLSGVADRYETSAIWRRVLSHVGRPKYLSYVITPYYNFYVVSAMAKMHHRRLALRWIRKFWGGMVNEGATSFWEAYNPTWPKGFLYQQNLPGDGTWGFHVSLAHGWASGVTPWLMSQILGIRPTAGGFARVDIEPHLLGLRWAKGGEPTPHGVLRVSIRKHQGYVTEIHLPPDEIAKVSVPVDSPGAIVTINGRQTKSVTADHGKRRVVSLTGQGTYIIASGQ